MNAPVLVLAITFTLPLVPCLQASPTQDRASQPIPAEALHQSALTAVSADSAKAANAIQQLRSAGPAGLDALFEAHATQIDRQLSPTIGLVAPADDPSWDRLRHALDMVGQQHDCHASHLYWYTDLAQAKRAAAASGRPILSLRLLGNLQVDRTCANSRFFRTTLYSNRSVSDYLRGHFILHWESVRPVPLITIDFGDGRRIERTITGNSVHYLLDPNGRVMDALPGLYGPRAFLRWLAVGEQAAARAEATEEDLDACRLEYHRERLAALTTQWAADLERLGKSAPAEPPLATDTAPAQADGTGAVVPACELVLTQTGLERPVLTSTRVRSDLDATALDARTDDSTWKQIAGLHAADAQLDPRSRVLIRSKHPPATEVSRRTLSKAVVEDPMIRTLQNLGRSISEDTVRNEYRLHRKIHEWFTSEQVPPSLEALNSRVYAELFLTPESDPWLGLAPDDAFAALDAGGLVQTNSTHSTP